MQAVSIERTNAREIQRTGNGDKSLVRDFLGIAGALHEGPSAFIVTLPDNGDRINPHFHDVDQFQVVVGGGGTMGKQDLRPLAFHYADAFTPYGPIVAGQEGLTYFTLRLAAASGHFNMPESRHLIQGGPGRNVASCFEPSKLKLLPNQTLIEALLPLQSDGLGAHGIHLGPNASMESSAPHSGAQYLIVCSGPVICSGNKLPALSLIFVPPEESVPALKAGEQGAELLLLQYPVASNRPGSNPEVLARRTLSGAFKLGEH